MRIEQLRKNWFKTVRATCAIACASASPTSHFRRINNRTKQTFLNARSQSARASPDALVAMYTACITKDIFREACVSLLGSRSMTEARGYTVVHHEDPGCPQLRLMIPSTSAVEGDGESVCEYWRGIVALVDHDIFALAGSCKCDNVHKLTDRQAEGQAVLNHIDSWASLHGSVGARCLEADEYVFASVGSIPVDCARPLSVGLLTEDRDHALAHVYRAVRMLFPASHVSVSRGPRDAKEHSLLAYRSVAAYDRTRSYADLLCALDATAVVAYDERDDFSCTNPCMAVAWADVYSTIEGCADEDMYKCIRRWLYPARYVCAEARVGAVDARDRPGISPPDVAAERQFLGLFDPGMACQQLRAISDDVRTSCSALSREMRVPWYALRYEYTPDVHHIATAYSSYSISSYSSRNAHLAMTRLSLSTKCTDALRGRCSFLDDIHAWIDESGTKDTTSVLRRVTTRHATVFGALMRRYRALLRLPCVHLLTKLGRVLCAQGDVLSMDCWEVYFVRLMVRRCQDAWAASTRACPPFVLLEGTCLRDAHLNMCIARMMDARCQTLGEFGTCGAWLDALVDCRVALSTALRVAALQTRDVFGWVQGVKAEALCLMKQNLQIRDAVRVMHYAALRHALGKQRDLYSSGVDIIVHMVAAADNIEQRTSLVLGYEKWQHLCISQRVGLPQDEQIRSLNHILSSSIRRSTQTMDPRVRSDVARVWRAHMLKCIHACRKWSAGVANTTVAAKKQCVNALARESRRLSSACVRLSRELSHLARAHEILCRQYLTLYADANIHTDVVLHANDDDDSDMSDYLLDAAVCVNDAGRAHSPSSAARVGETRDEGTTTDSGEDDEEEGGGVSEDEEEERACDVAKRRRIRTLRHQRKRLHKSGRVGVKTSRRAWHADGKKVVA